MAYHQNQSAKFSCAKRAEKCSAVNLLNSGVVISLLWSDISFSTSVRVVVVAKLVILSILFLASFILALKAAVIAKLVVLGISFLASFILAIE